MKVLCLLVMIALLNITLINAKKENIKTKQVYSRVNHKTNNYESFDKKHPNLEIDRMVKGVYIMKSHIRKFFSFSLMKTDPIRPLLSALFNSADELSSQLLILQGNSANSDVSNISKMRKAYDELRNSFLSKTTLPWHIYSVQSNNKDQLNDAPLSPSRMKQLLSSEKKLSLQSKSVDQMFQSILMEPIHVVTNYEWRFVNNGEHLRVDVVRKQNQAWFLLGGLSLLQKSIQTIDFFKSSHPLNEKIKHLQFIGEMCIHNIKKAIQSNKQISGDTIQDRLDNYRKILNSFSLLMQDNDEAIKKQYDTAIRFEASLPLGSWPNIAFANSGKKLIFDEVKKIQNTKILLGGLMLLQGYIQTIDGFEDCKKLQERLKAVTVNSSKTLGYLKQALRNGCSKNHADVKKWINQIGDDLNDYVTALSQYKPAKF